MKKNAHYFGIVGLVVALAFTACNTTNKAKTGGEVSQQQQAIKKGQKPDNVALSLADYLRREPGVQVMGKGDNVRVQIRGGNLTVNGASTPLFVIDGAPMGNDYNHVADIINIQDIEKIEVLRDVASTNHYGLQGSAGVIVITTKKQ